MKTEPDRWIKLSDEYFALFEFENNTFTNARVFKISIISVRTGYLKKLTIDNNLNISIERVTENQSIHHTLSKIAEVTQPDENLISNLTIHIFDSALNFIIRNLKSAKKMIDNFGVLFASEAEVLLMIFSSNYYFKLTLDLGLDDNIYITFNRNSGECFITYVSHNPPVCFTGNAKLSFESHLFKYTLSFINIML